MALSELVKARNCGQICFHVIYDYPIDLNRILEKCSLKPVAEKLLQIERNDAIRVLTRWLHRDPAYDTELMTANLAGELAENFFQEFSDETSRFFTNGRWFESEGPQTWEPLTEAVFDGGVLIESGKGNCTRHICIWFKDED